jgi:nucleoside-diphosphate-sugar epimerase
MPETILITGGTGFAGSHLVELLVSQGVTNIHCTQFGSKSSSEIKAFSQVTTHTIDLTDSASTNALLAEIQPTQIYHLASFA